MDLKVTAWICFMFFAVQLDRGNIAQALSDNMLTDLGLTTNDYKYSLRSNHILLIVPSS